MKSAPPWRSRPGCTSPTSPRLAPPSCSTRISTSCPTSLKPNISTKLFVRPDAPTVVKRRFTDVHRLTNLFELTFLNEHPLPEKTEGQLGAYLERITEDYDLVIVADFGHGLLGPRTIDVLQKHAPYLAMNVQTNSANMGYNPVTKYQRADYVCIHENELRLANHDQFG